ncbi:MAG: hypothetical protein O3A92_12255 [Verrucomicrobia bacterium]|nr:hypothetical protein [Verrucomicrobiota bacterium]
MSFISDAKFTILEFSCEWLRPASHDNLTSCRIGKEVGRRIRESGWPEGPNTLPGFKGEQGAF